MRVNKFRAYDRKWKLMSNIIRLKNGIDFFHFKEADAPHTRSLCSGTLIIMQYIELKDKNGVEIYEGDILTLDGSKHYQVKYIAPKYVLSDEDGDMIFDSKVYFEERKIVGNIYEIPELLHK